MVLMRRIFIGKRVLLHKIPKFHSFDIYFSVLLNNSHIFMYCCVSLCNQNIVFFMFRAWNFSFPFVSIDVNVYRMNWNKSKKKESYWKCFSVRSGVSIDFTFFVCIGVCVCSSVLFLREIRMAKSDGIKCFTRSNDCWLFVKMLSKPWMRGRKDELPSHIETFFCLFDHWLTTSNRLSLICTVLTCWLCEAESQIMIFICYRCLKLRHQVLVVNELLSAFFFMWPQSLHLVGCPLI